MTEQASRPRDFDPGNPFWTVQSVFDDEGLGGDFAYTIGLAGRGLPELHIWARPTDGFDPGEDWKFSGPDLCRTLNEFAGYLLQGTLHPGSEFHRSYDDGSSRVSFVVGHPVDRLEVEAFAVQPVVSCRPKPTHATVCVWHWTVDYNSYSTRSAISGWRPRRRSNGSRWLL